VHPKQGSFSELLVTLVAVPVLIGLVILLVMALLGLGQH